MTEEARLADFPHIHIVEASAGSGKTYCLARRYLQLIINPHLRPDEIPINNILAITFTNKASLEMKERILEFLKRAALDRFVKDREKESILSGLGVTNEAARKKAHLVMDHLIRNYNFFQVQTIDSFINAILSGCAFKVGLSSNFKVRTDYPDYLAYTLDKLIDRAASQPGIREIMNSFLRQYLYIENRAGWFPKKDMLEIITQLFRMSNKYGLGFSPSPVSSEEVIIKKKLILKLLHELNLKLPTGTYALFAQKLPVFLENNPESFDIESLSKYLEDPEEFPIKKNGVVPDEVFALWKDIHQNIKELCEIEAVSIYNSYIQIFNLVSRDLKDLASKEDVLFLESMNKEAGELFVDRSVSPPELYYRLATRLRHFLIDEFQDTSILQWKNLRPMVEEALSTGGSLFYVGDKKQAIYRFRGGEVTLMDLVKKDFPGFKAIEGSLNRNFRSFKEIVEFNNEVFSPDNLRRFLAQFENEAKSAFSLAPIDQDEIVGVFQASRQSCGQEYGFGYIKIESIDAPGRSEKEALIRDKLLRLIDNLSKRYNPGEMALLTRENSEVKLLSEWLLEKGIPVESEKTLNIRENSLIKELVSFLRFLNSPIDDLAFASFILGDIFAVSSGIKRKELEEFLFTVRDKKNDQRGYLYREFRGCFPQAWEGLIEEFFKNVGFVPLYELTVSMIEKFSVLTNFSEYQGFFMRLLELIKKYEEEEPGISGFLEYFDKAPEEELYVNISGVNSIKILTIHKAKGLEFPVVVVPFLEMNIKADTQVVYPQNEQLSLLRLKKRYASFSPRLRTAYDQEYKKAFIDELNNIYVALTRAVEELHIFIPRRSGRGVNPASWLFPQIDLEKGKSPESRKQKSVNKTSLSIPASKYKNWISLLKEEFIDVSLLREREKVQSGDIMHYILSFIGNLHSQDEEKAAQEAISQARARFNLSSGSRSYEDALRRIIRDKHARIFFDCPEHQVFQEKEVVDSFGNTLRIDRLLLNTKEAIVIDYKSSRIQGDEYLEQVRLYTRIIRQIYPKLAVKGYLIYLDTCGLEEVNE